MAQEKDLFVGELLRQTYKKLAERHPHREIVFPEKALAEIADDSDWHRTKKGYMGYKSANLFEFNSRTWAVIRGEKCGSYPAEPYDSDISALVLTPDKKTKKQTQEELIKKISGSHYFRNSLIHGMADGMVGIGTNNPGYINNPFKDRMLKLLEPRLPEFVAQKQEYDKRFILASTLTPVVTKPILYKPEFADFLAGSIEKVLREAG